MVAVFRVQRIMYNVLFCHSLPSLEISCLTELGVAKSPEKLLVCPSTVIPRLALFFLPEIQSQVSKHSFPS